MKIAFDVMSGDSGSKEAILAACQMVKEFDNLTIILVGNEEEIQGHLQKIFKTKTTPKKIDIHPATDVIPMTAGPFEALRMPNSSMSQAVNLVKQKKADGVVSSGSTAAYLGVCHLLLGEIPGIKRPAFMPIMPTLKGTKVVLLDVGANIENSVDELISFALMADIYSRLILNVPNPAIALLNIGLEANKGPKTTKETYEKLNQLTRNDEKLSFLNFRGNIEPREVLSGEVDIVVCDGYSGNIVLKSCEGMASLIFTLLKQAYKKNFWTKLLGLISKPVFKRIKTTFDYKNTGGAQLIGINGICFKAHGSSDQQAYYSTLKLLRTAIEQDVTTKIKTQIKAVL
ncbi:MAG: phosphate acyltransferase PlsX [Spiroplasma sp.]|nr:phosphate acyltransferase PlsX [Spiroplasma sp.]